MHKAVYHYLCPMNLDASGYALDMLDDFNSWYGYGGDGAVKPLRAPEKLMAKGVQTDITV